MFFVSLSGSPLTLHVLTHSFPTPHSAVLRDRTHGRFRGRHAAAVDGRRIEVRIEAAHGNEASLALIVQDIDARRTAKRLGDVLVGKLADRVAGQHRLHAISGTMPGNRATEALLLADAQDGGFLVPVGVPKYVW